MRRLCGIVASLAFSLGGCAAISGLDDLSEESCAPDCDAAGIPDALVASEDGSTALDAGAEAGLDARAGMDSATSDSKPPSGDAAVEGSANNDASPDSATAKDGAAGDAAKDSAVSDAPLDSTVLDAGSDAATSDSAPAQDAVADTMATDDAGEDGPSSGDDAGPPPTLWNVSPNWGSAAGGWTIGITGANLDSVLAVIVDGVPCTSVNTSANFVTAVVPAFSGGPNGAIDGRVITVSSPAGSASTAGNQQNYFYLPSNNAIAFAHRGDIVTSPSGITVSNVPDFSGNGNDWVQTSATAQPNAASDYNSTGLDYLTFDGASQSMQMSFTSAIVDQYSFYLVGNYTSSSASAFAEAFGGTGGIEFGSFGSFFYFFNGSGGIALGTADVQPHIFGMISATDSFVSEVDEISSMNAPVTGLLNGPNSLGMYETFFAGFYFFADLGYVGAVSAADDVTIRSILKAVAGTP